MNATDPNGHCIGRFQFRTAPALVVSGRSQQIYRVDIKTVALPTRATTAHVWAARVAAIRQTGAAGQDAVVRSFDLEPDLPAVWYYGRPGERTHVTLEAMKAFPDHTLQLVYEITGEPQAATERAYRRIVAGYVPGGRTGFCLEHGALVSEPSRSEDTRIAFRHVSLAGFELSLASDAVDVPDTRDVLRDVEDERRILMESGSEVVILRNEARTVAQLPGVDSRIRMSARGAKPFVRFTWRFSGRAGDATAPQLTLVGTALAPDQAQLELVWEAVLQSLKRMPQSPATR